MERRRILAFVAIVAAFALLSRQVAQAPLAPPPLPEAAVLAAEERGAPVGFVLPDLAGGSRDAAEWHGRLVLLMPALTQLEAGR